MPCYHPLKGWRSRLKTPTGKRKILFKKPEIGGEPLDLPCGQCIGCRLERSRQWAARCMHEAQTHDQNCFITLTYSEKHKPHDGSLDKTHFQQFMKRLRYHYDGDTLRYFQCGEYGENFQRPHYHACLFGIDLEDRALWKESNGVKIYTSKELEKIWGMGFCTVGDVTFESAAYTARYITKKITGENAEAHYDGRTPEYINMSRNGGIGKTWFQLYQKEVYPADEIITRGHPTKPPRYYDKLFEQHHGDIEAVKATRQRKAKQHADNQTPDRLRVRETVLHARITQLKRGYENDA